MLYIISIIDNETNTASVSEYFYEELKATHYFTNLIGKLSENLSTKYPGAEITALQVKNNRFEIFVKTYGWLSTSKVLTFVVQLIEVEETEPVEIL